MSHIKLLDKVAVGGIPPDDVYYELADNVLEADDSVVSETGTSWVKSHEHVMVEPGWMTILTSLPTTLRIYFELRSIDGAYAYGKVRRNGSAVGTERSTTSSSWVSYTEDISGWDIDDKIQLYIKSGFDGYEMQAQNFRVLGWVRSSNAEDAMFE